MELRQYIRIIHDNKRLFWGAVLLTVLATFLFFILRPISYDASLTLNISRKGNQETLDYKYDDYYRLQADEKFAETIVEWMQSPRIVANIFTESGINPNQFTLNQLTKSFKAEKRSSQVVSVNFNSGDERISRRISDSIIAVLSSSTEDLNKNQRENTWFEINPQQAVVLKKSFSPLLVLAVSLFIGIFIGFWASLIKHYLKD